MKKVKLTTVTLALLAGTVVAPLISVAEESPIKPTSEVKKEADLEAKKLELTKKVNELFDYANDPAEESMKLLKDVDAAKTFEDLDKVNTAVAEKIKAKEVAKEAKTAKEAEQTLEAKRLEVLKAINDSFDYANDPAEESNKLIEAAQAATTM